MSDKLDKKSVTAWLTALKPDAISDLVVDLEDVWEIEEPYRGPSIPGMGMPLEYTMGTEPEVTYRVTLVEVGGDRLQVIKMVRKHMGVALADAKAMADSAPILMFEDLGREEADEIRRIFESVGARVEVR